MGWTPLNQDIWTFWIFYVRKRVIWKLAETKPVA